MFGRRAVVLLTLLCVRHGVARADGAFPDSLEVLLPSDRPAEIVLTTNFGLIISEDAGVTWTWTCESPSSSGAYLYSMSAAPMDRVLGIAPVGLAHSDDGGCSWALAAGLDTSSTIVDVFPDPNDGRRVWSIVSASGSKTIPDQVFRSDDGGDTLGTSVFQAPIGALLTGVESSRSDPSIVYAAMYVPIAAADYPVRTPVLLRSSDGGQTWSPTEVTAGIGPTEFRIMAVDPTDPQTLYLRVMSPRADEVAVTKDGGATFNVPITLPDTGEVTAFARLASGTLLVAGLVLDSPVGYRSTDGGATFADWPNVPFLRGLSERSGQLYAASDNMYVADWAIGTSADEGLTFQPVVAYSQVSGVKTCASASCRDVCTSEVAASVWPATVCAQEMDAGEPVDAEAPPPDAAGPEDARAAEAGTEGGADRGGPTTADGSHGCSCDTSVARAPAAALPILLFAIGFLRACSRRSATSYRCSSGRRRPPSASG
jgi:hypothetical protein